MRFLPFVFATLLCLAGMPVHAKVVAIQQIWYGDDGLLDKQTFVTAQTQTQWIDIWKKVKQSQSIQPLPKNQMAVAIFGGSKTTSGYRSVINDIREKDASIVVIYNILGPDRTNIAALPYNTVPWTVAIVPYSEKPIVFEREKAAFVVKMQKILDWIVEFFASLFSTGFKGKH